MFKRVMAYSGKEREQKFILECIRLYKDLPALWNMKCRAYYERGKKNASYNILLKKFREVYPDATKLDIRKKFNVLRTNYRKEMKKKNSMNNYKPSLWYFNEFHFLNDQKPEIESSIDLSLEDGMSDAESSVSADILESDNLLIKVEHDEHSTTENGVEFVDSLYEKEVGNSRTQTATADNNEEEVLILSNEDVCEKKDEHFYWAISCAADIRKMDHVQQIYAKKAIAEILMEGQLGLLHRNSVKLNEASSS